MNKLSSFKELHHYTGHNQSTEREAFSGTQLEVLIVADLICQTTSVSH